MGRMIYLMTSIVAINIALLLFTCSSWDAQGECIPQTALWSYLLHPSEIDNSNFWEVLFGTSIGLAALAGGILIIGSFLFRSETPLFLGMALSLVYPVYSWVKFYQQIQGSAFFAGREVEGTIVAILVASPIILAYIFTLLDWSRGRD